MSLSDKELAFIEKNIVLEEVGGEIVIDIIKTDVGRVDGHVGRAKSAGLVQGHVGRAKSVDFVDGHVSRAGSVDRVLDRIDGRVRLAESVVRIGTEENES